MPLEKEKQIVVLKKKDLADLKYLLSYFKEKRVGQCFFLYFFCQSVILALTKTKHNFIEFYITYHFYSYIVCGGFLEIRTGTNSLGRQPAKV